MVEDRPILSAEYRLPLLTKTDQLLVLHPTSGSRGGGEMSVEGGGGVNE